MKRSGDATWASASDDRGGAKRSLRPTGEEGAGPEIFPGPAPESIADRRFSSKNDLDPTSAPRFFLSWRPSSPARFAPSPPHERAPSVPRPLPSRSEGISSGVRPASRARHALPILAPRVSPPPPDPINAAMFRGSFAPRAAKLGNAAAAADRAPPRSSAAPGPSKVRDEREDRPRTRPSRRLSFARTGAPPPSGRARMMDSKPSAARWIRSARRGAIEPSSARTTRLSSPALAAGLRARARRPPPAARASPLSLAPRLGADRRPSPPPPHARRRPYGDPRPIIPFAPPLHPRFLRVSVLRARPGSRPRLRGLHAPQPVQHRGRHRLGRDVSPHGDGVHDEGGVRRGRRVELRARRAVRRPQPPPRRAS